MTAPPELLTPTSPAEAAAAFGDGAGVTVIGGGTILAARADVRPAAAHARRSMPGRAGLSGVDSCERRRPHRRDDAGRRARRTRPEPLATAAQHVADREIRAVGTIGGNLCARPAASAPRGDLQAPLIALGAQVRSAGAGGERTEAVEDFLARLAGRPARALDRVRGGPPGRLRPLDRPHAHPTPSSPSGDRRRRRPRRPSHRGLRRRRRTPCACPAWSGAAAARGDDAAAPLADASSRATTRSRRPGTARASCHPRRSRLASLA